MAGTNLDISVSATTSKARAEFELLNAKVRELRKEVRAASNEAQAGGGMTARLTESAKQLTAAEAQQRAYARAARATTEANVEASASFAGLTKNMEGFARGAGMALGGIKGLRAGLAAMVGAGIVKGFTDLLDKITEISDTSKKTGFDPATIQAFSLALEKTGGKAEDASTAFDKLASHSTVAVDIYGKAIAQAGDGTDEFSKALRALNIDVTRVKPGTDQFFVSVAQGLVKLKEAGRIDEANVLSSAILGKNYREIGGGLEQIAKSGGLDALKQLATTGVASPEALEAVKQYKIALSGLKTAWDDLLVTIGKSGAFQAVADLMKEITETINTTTKEIEGLVNAFKSAFASFDQWAQTKRPFGGEVRGGGDSSTNADYGGGYGFASGGYVRGPGSGTSDSILARLSNGEFVVRAAAVDRWGPQFLNALNNMRNPFGGFAGGGLVSGGAIPSFAGGGMVHTAGATVNLVFPGGTFALRADNETVGALTREARRAGMLSGGRRAGLLQ